MFLKSCPILLCLFTLCQIFCPGLQFPKHGKSGYLQYGKGMGKRKHFTFMGFLYISVMQKSMEFPKYGKSEFTQYEKSMGKTEISHIFCYLADLELMRTHAILNVWESINSRKMEIFCGKPYHSQAVGFGGDQKLLRNPNNPQSMDNVKFHTIGILWGKVIYSYTMGFE